MKRMIVALLFSWFSMMAYGAGGNGYPLDPIDTDHSDKASLQRGLKYYQNYCAACHGMSFQRYERVADDLGIPHDLMMENIVFNPDAKIGDLMTNSLDPYEAKQFFGVVPPDLTLVSRVRGESWLYTYLRTFYEDPKRPLGVNNKVFPDVGMPHALLDLQGVQVGSCAGGDFGAQDPLTGDSLCTLTIDPERQGAMSPAEFDQAVYDLVNFMSYSAEPMRTARQQMGIYVLLFLVIFGVFAYLLKREYWKDVH
ncbi:Cytochrome c1 [invertebrate metagenome]|uniref:Cytochrome c1 n=1 Tax=invertebrate metagenome TaxID=1711999 RepID=A0A2H9T5N7_9ZZZZ